MMSFCIAGKYVLPCDKLKTGNVAAVESIFVREVIVFSFDHQRDAQLYPHALLTILFARTLATDGA